MEPMMDDAQAEGIFTFSLSSDYGHLGERLCSTRLMGVSVEEASRGHREDSRTYRLLFLASANSRSSRYSAVAPNTFAQ